MALMMKLSPAFGTLPKPYSPKVGVGLYGVNGHQIDRNLKDSESASLIAVAGFPAGRLKDSHESVAVCPGLEDLLQIPELDIVVLCPSGQVRTGRPSPAWRPASTFWPRNPAR